MTTMSWNKLLNTSRRRRSKSVIDKQYHNEFDKDFSRIVYSSSVRRLQGKAQVFPLQENDFTRTRLTHSIEVMSLGESLAWNIGNQLMDKGVFESVWQIKELASMVKTSSLVHDLGNPPFGHYGEDVIGNWFKSWFEKNEEYAKELSESEKSDFCNFEGNAQSLRILSKLQILNDEYGANFTYGTLATLIKYPWNSTHKLSKEKGKFGYFTSEQKLFEEICVRTGIGPHKHPATLIMEAADDIAYLPTDIEDGVKKGVVSCHEIESNSNLLKTLMNVYPDNYKKLESNNYLATKNKVPDLELVKSQNLKITLQGIFIKEVVETYLNNYESIMEGTFNSSLLKRSKANDLREDCKDVAKRYIFTNDEVLALELVGDKVISELLEFFVNAIVDDKNCEDTREKSGKLYNLISDNHRYVFNSNNSKSIKEKSLYSKLQLVTDYISGMTDNYALSLHQKLLGIKMP